MYGYVQDSNGCLWLPLKQPHGHISSVVYLKMSVMHDLEQVKLEGQALNSNDQLLISRNH